MALIWQQQRGQTLYEVRGAGASRRLYENGILHTQYHPDRLLTGSVWDLLTIPALFLPRERLRRALLLGVGGGAVVRQLQQLFPQLAITAVEINPLYLELGREYFDLGGERLELHVDDAVSWLEEYRGEPFDLIIDDLFTEVDGEPQRAVPLEEGWFACLSRNLAEGGALVANCADSGELHAAAWFHSAAMRRPFASAFRLLHPQCENAVAVFLKRQASSGDLRAAVNAVPELDTRKSGAALRYTIRSL